GAWRRYTGGRALRMVVPQPHRHEAGHLALAGELVVLPAPLLDAARGAEAAIALQARGEVEAVERPGVTVRVFQVVEAVIGVGPPFQRLLVGPVLLRV